MDCTVCNVRSSVAYCSECQTLLCEECGAVCDECAKRMCPLHTNVTRHGRTLCGGCYREYSDRRSRREAEADGIDLAPGTGEPHGRLKRTHEPVRPWLASLYMALLGVVAVGILLFFPALRRIEWGPRVDFPTAYIVIVLPSLAIAWAFLGLFTRWSPASKSLNLIGLTIAVATIVLAFFAVRPERSWNVLQAKEDGSVATESERANLSRDKLHGWRSDMLQRYDEENVPGEPKKRDINLEELVPPPTRQ